MDGLTNIYEFQAYWTNQQQTFCAGQDLHSIVRPDQQSNLRGMDSAKICFFLPDMIYVKYPTNMKI